VVSTAGAGTLALARKLQPDAITLDLGLSDIDGFVLLDLLKHDPKTRHLPIHVISGADQAELVLGMGAFSVTTKPADHEELNQVFRSIHNHLSRTDRRVLVIGGDAKLSQGGVGHGGRRQSPGPDRGERGQGQGGPCRLRRLPGRGRRCRGAEAAPRRARRRRREHACSGDARSQLGRTRLGGDRVGRRPRTRAVHSLDKLSARLGPVLRRGRRPTNDNDSTQPTSIRSVPELAGAKMLIVDDDIRNIYSLTSVLESYDVNVLHAERGREGISLLEQNPDIDIALIDIMMPEMDGYETMRQIRSKPSLADVPLVAVTAKAMKGDRQKCLDAGASDYIAKPVDIELLLALLRVWISRSRERATSTAPRLAPAAAE
jgi:CheY-like chemotaxis protein